MKHMMKYHAVYLPVRVGVGAATAARLVAGWPIEETFMPLYVYSL